jgi:hypothetical protein
MPNHSVRPQILRFLARQDRYIGVGAIAAGAGVSRPSVRKVLDRLKAEGRLDVGTVPADPGGDQRRTGWPGYRLKQPEPDAFTAMVKAAAYDEQLTEAYTGIGRIAAAAGITLATYDAQSMAEVCDMIAAWCAEHRPAPPLIAGHRASEPIRAGQVLEFDETGQVRPWRGTSNPIGSAATDAETNQPVSLPIPHDIADWVPRWYPGDGWRQ